MRYLSVLKIYCSWNVRYIFEAIKSKSESNPRVIVNTIQRFSQEIVVSVRVLFTNASTNSTKLHTVQNVYIVILLFLIFVQ